MVTWPGFNSSQGPGKGDSRLVAYGVLIGGPGLDGLMFFRHLGGIEGLFNIAGSKVFRGVPERHGEWGVTGGLSEHL